MALVHSEQSQVPVMLLKPPKAKHTLPKSHKQPASLHCEEHFS